MDRCMKVSGRMGYATAKGSRDRWMGRFTRGPSSWISATDMAAFKTKKAIAIRGSG